MIDEEFKVWFIECNTNPCIEESSKLLKKLLPRMLDDAFRLTLDQMFPPLGNHTLRDLPSYPIENYKNEENMW